MSLKQQILEGLLCVWRLASYSGKEPDHGAPVVTVKLRNCGRK